MAPLCFISRLTHFQAKKFNVRNTYSNYSSILTYTDEGHQDYKHLIHDFNKHYSIMEQNAGTLLKKNLQDQTTRAGLGLAGWKPKQNMKKQAVEWWVWGKSSCARRNEELGSIDTKT